MIIQGTEKRRKFLTSKICFSLIFGGIVLIKFEFQNKNSKWNRTWLLTQRITFHLGYHHSACETFMKNIEETD